MDSLYASRPGASFTIKASFSSYDAMVEKFKQGPNYTDCWYNEYCLLSTSNKNHPDNGKIFKRGLNYTDSKTGGAIYVGQIVGPSSGTPFMEMSNIESVVDKSKNPRGDNEYYRYPVMKNGQVGSNWEKDGNTWKDNEGPIYTGLSFNTTNKSLVPGKYEEDGVIKYNDDIKYTWLNIRKDDENEDSWFYVGIKLPYHVNDFVSTTVSQYDNEGIINPNSATVTKDEAISEEHPFYDKWTIGIPKGIKGDTLSNLRVITPTADNNNASKPENYIYSQDAFVQNDNGTIELKANVQSYPTIQEDITNQYKILIYDYYIYDKNKKPRAYQVYISRFNTIKGIGIADDGTVTVTYTAQGVQSIEKRIRWVKDISLSTQPGRNKDNNSFNGGLFKVVYNTSTPEKEDIFTSQMQWVNDIFLEDDGHLTYTMVGDATADNNGKKQSSNVIKGIKNIAFGTNKDENGNLTDDGKLTITYNTKEKNPPYNNETSVYTLSWVKDIVIADDGTVTFKKTNNASISQDKLIKLIKRAYIDDKGMFHIQYNTGVDETVKLDPKDDTKDFILKYMTKVAMGEPVTEKQNIVVTYNTGETTTLNAINSIEKMFVRPTDWHLFVLYSEPSKRYNFTSTAGSGEQTAPDTIVYNNKTWVKHSVIKQYVPEYDDKKNFDNVYWHDLGSIKDQSGVLIGGNVTDEDLKLPVGTEQKVYPEIIDYLNARWPNGLTSQDNTNPAYPSVAQKIVTYQAGEEVNKRFYAFDYLKSTGGWYYLGSIGDDGTRDVQMGQQANINTLNSKGLFFKQETYSVLNEPLPSYWESSYSGSF